MPEFTYYYDDCQNKVSLLGFKISDCSVRNYELRVDCSIRVSHCPIRVTGSFTLFLCLHCFKVVYLKDVYITLQGELITLY